MLRAAMLMLAAVLMLIAMSHLQDEDKPPSPPDPGPRASKKKQAGNETDEVSMCIVYTCGCSSADARCNVAPAG
jgi:uncharacterized protein YfaQ (DUF2300 family)